MGLADGASATPSHGEKIIGKEVAAELDADALRLAQMGKSAPVRTKKVSYWNFD